MHTPPLNYLNTNLLLQDCIHNYMVTRAQDSFRDGIEKYVMRDLFTNSRVVDSPLLLKHVDAEAVNKARFSLYKQQSEGIRRMTTSTEDAADMEKYRATKGDYGLDAREWALHEYPEKFYFDYYQEGINGDPVMDAPNTPYKCPCGVSMEMNIKNMPEYCPVFHHITPIGRMIQDKIMRR